MKRIFLLIIITCGINNSLRGAQDELPLAFNKQELMQFKMPLKDLLKIIKKEYSTLSKMEEFSFSKIKQSLLSKKELSENIIDILAFIMVTFSQRHHSLPFQVCPCMALEFRVINIFYSLIFFTRMIEENKLILINYVSFASGKLLPDYIMIMSLIKLGFLNINIALIDTKYDKQYSDKESIKIKIEALKLHLKTLERFSLKQETQGQIARLEDEERILNLMENFKLKLSTMAQDYHKKYNVHYSGSLSVKFWESADAYINNLDHFAKHKEVKSADENPHIIFLSDSAEVKSERDSIMQNFEKIMQKPNLQGAIVSTLEKENDFQATPPQALITFEFQKIVQSEHNEIKKEIILKVVDPVVYSQ
ncbi:hypothetical protein K9K77_02710 [Candidatus Babeliales bacterium]|nr:hypothetical protein [Candidatus Babeliales bacterium]